MLMIFFCADLLPQNITGHAYDHTEMQECMKGESEKENKESKSGREADEYVPQSFLPGQFSIIEFYLDLAYLKGIYQVPLLDGPFLPPELS